MTVTMPYLKYLHSHDDKWPAEDIVGDIPLFNVHDVAVSNRNGLSVIVTGRARKKDGLMSRHNRCSVIDVDAEQPQWLAAIIEDAKVRLDA